MLSIKFFKICSLEIPLIGRKVKASCVNTLSNIRESRFFLLFSIDFYRINCFFDSKRLLFRDTGFESTIFFETWILRENLKFMVSKVATVQLFWVS